MSVCCLMMVFSGVAKRKICPSSVLSGGEKWSTSMGVALLQSHVRFFCRFESRSPVLKGRDGLSDGGPGIREGGLGRCVPLLCRGLGGAWLRASRGARDKISASACDAYGRIFIILHRRSQ